MPPTPFQSRIRLRHLSVSAACGISAFVLSLSGCDSAPPAGNSVQQAQPRNGPRPTSSPAATDAQMAKSATLSEKPEPAQPAAAPKPEGSQPVPSATSKPAAAQEIPDYLIVVERIESNKAASVAGRVSPPDRLTVDTSNVARLRIDRSRLPFAAGRRVALRIDDQGVELTGKSQIIELVRSRNGAWAAADAARAP